MLSPIFVNNQRTLFALPFSSNQGGNLSLPVDGFTWPDWAEPSGMKNLAPSNKTICNVSLSIAPRNLSNHTKSACKLPITALFCRRGFLKSTFAPMKAPRDPAQPKSSK